MSFPSSFRLIEEFMLLANMAVARKISKCFPAISLLRRHPPPKSRGVESLVCLNQVHALVNVTA